MRKERLDMLTNKKVIISAHNFIIVCYESFNTCFMFFIIFSYFEERRTTSFIWEKIIILLYQLLIVSMKTKT